MCIRSYKEHQPEIHESVWIDPSAVVIGNVKLEKDVSVWPHVTIRGDVNSITVGHLTNIQDGAVLHCTHDGPYTTGGKSLVVGSQVTIGHQACLHGCTIGNNVLIGIRSIILDGAIIKDFVMIGAGSLVPPGKVLESGYLYVGSPAKMSRPLKNSEKEALSYSATHYRALATEHKKVTG